MSHPSRSVATVDRRTRRFDDLRDLDIAGFLADELPAVLAETGELAAIGVATTGLAPLRLVVGDFTASLVVRDGRLVAETGETDDGSFADGVVARLDEAAASDLLQDVASTFGLLFTARADVAPRDRDDWLRWEPVLRAALDGRAVYTSGSISFLDRHGDELDLHRSFDLAGSLDDAGHFLAEAGFVHLRGVFTESEMAKVADDLVTWSGRAAPDDGDSWWASTTDGESYPSRILRFADKSETLRHLLDSDRFQRIRDLVADDLAPDPPEAEGLHKKAGVVTGISDVSWHKDCSQGGHSRTCSSLIVGLSITGAGPTNGELGVVAGSNRANVSPIGAAKDLDLPRIALPTETGDLTIHCSCTLHMSRPPVSAPRMVAYSGSSLAPIPGDHTPQRDAEAAHQDRAETGGRRERLEGMTISDFELESS